MDWPPCYFYVKGKEHLLARNPEIGQYYEARQWDDKRKTLAVEMAKVFRKSRKTDLRVLPTEPEGATTAQLWLLSQQSADRLMAEAGSFAAVDDSARMAEHKPHSDLPPSWHGALLCHDAGRPVMQDGAADDARPAWNSLEDWRLRQFTFKDDGGDEAELSYWSETTEIAVRVCLLSRSDPALVVRLLPRISLEPLSPTSKEELRFTLKTYELAFSPLQQMSVGPLPDVRGRSGAARLHRLRQAHALEAQGLRGCDSQSEDIPSELYPLALSWTDEDQIRCHIVLAHGVKEQRDKWLCRFRKFSQSDS